MDFNNLQSEYLSLFLVDTREYMSLIDEALQDFENGKDKMEIVKNVFRAVHSIKGSSATLGFKELAEFTHVYESLLGEVREGNIKDNPEVLDLMYKGVDLLEAFIVGIETEKTDTAMIKYTDISQEEYKQIKSRVGEIAEESKNTANKKKKIAAKTQVEESKPEEPDRTYDNKFEIKITFTKETQMKNVKAFLFYKRLKEVGKIDNAYPPEEDIKSGVINDNDYNTINLLYDTDETKEEIVELLDDIDIDKLEIKKYKDNIPETKEIKSASEVINTETKKVKIKEYIKVERDKLDTLLNTVGELVIDKSRYNQMRMKLKSIYMELSDKGIDKKTLKNLHLFGEEFKKINKSLEREANELQEEITSLRMVPIKELFVRLPRTIRDIAHRIGKEIDVEIIGEETELDKIIIEKLSDPLLHMIRNSIDHGIEMPEARKEAGKSAKGLIKIEAFNQGNEIVVKVSDDGAGIDVDRIATSAVKKGLIEEFKISGMTFDEKLSLIFLPGFSTAAEVTNICGRGVGMDVVKSNIESMKGRVEIVTEKGKGTEFSIKLPLTLAIIKALLVNVGKDCYAFSIDAVVTTVKTKRENLENINGTNVIKLRDTIVPVFDLMEMFDTQCITENCELNADIVVIRRGEHLFGFIVDQLLYQQEIVIKNIEGNYHRQKGISGAAILGDGRLTLVLDLNNLLEFYLKNNKILK